MASFKIYAPAQMNFAANILMNKIKELGHSCERVPGINKHSNDYYIVYNSAMLKVFPKRLISYQTEQSGTRWFNDRYREILSWSVAVWEYCESNLFEYYNPNISMVKPGIEIQPKVEKDIDVLFYGGINERRKNALNGIMCMKVDNVWNDDMQKLISRAKTVLNIHYYEPNCFETFRINEALSHNCNVVSEHSLYGIEPYEGIVKFGEINELKDLLKQVETFDHDISHLDNTEQIKEALKLL